MIFDKPHILFSRRLFAGEASALRLAVAALEPIGR